MRKKDHFVFPQALYLSGSRETGSSWFNFLSFPCRRFKHSCRYSLWVKCSAALWIKKTLNKVRWLHFSVLRKPGRTLYRYISPHIYKYCSAMRFLQWNICLFSGHPIFSLWLILSTQSKENSPFGKTPGKTVTKSRLDLHFISPKIFFIIK